MYNFIHDEKEVNNFFSILSPLKRDEVYFISLSARNKYLSKEEREYYNLGRTEMFSRKLIRQDRHIKSIKSLETNDGSYLTKNGLDIPSKCIIVYANINPSSGIKAYKMFQETTMNDVFQSMENPDIMNNFSKLDVKLMNCFQKSTGTKTLIDIDFDIPEKGKSILYDFINVIKNHNAEYYVIDTHSGYHVLLKKETIKFNYTEYVNIANDIAQETFGNNNVEVVVNKNAMVPIPGTFQGEYKVKFIKVK
ncbi:MAG: hypothetical protein ACOC1O_00110 [bacterium]